MRMCFLLSALSVLLFSISSFVYEEKRVIVEAPVVKEEKVIIEHPHHHHHETVIIEKNAPCVEEKIEIK